MWGPATFTGKVFTQPGGHGRVLAKPNPDSDLDLLLIPDEEAGITLQKKGSQYDGTIGLEFSSAETIKWFGTNWWRRIHYHRSSDYVLEPLAFFLRHKHKNSGPPPSLNGEAVTVVGLFGLDAEHFAHPELHPVYALAIRTGSQPDGDTWQLFARAWGTAGDCGNRWNHVLDMSSMTLELHSGTGVTYGAASARLYDHGRPLSPDDWSAYAGPRGGLVEIRLPQSPCGLVEGELKLFYRGPAVANERALPTAYNYARQPVRLSVSDGSGHLCTKRLLGWQEEGWEETK